MPERDFNKKRDTARAIIIKDGQMLLIDRTRPGMHYYSTPGGGIEPGETPEQAVVREVYEEASIKASVERELYIWRKGVHEHHFFLCNYISGEPKLQETAEENNDGPGHGHVPLWVSLASLDPGSFGPWELVRERLLSDIQNGFPPEVVILTS